MPEISGKETKSFPSQLEKSLSMQNTSERRYLNLHIHTHTQIVDSGLPLSRVQVAKLLLEELLNCFLKRITLPPWAHSWWAELIQDTQWQPGQASAVLQGPFVCRQDLTEANRGEREELRSQSEMRKTYHNRKGTERQVDNQQTQWHRERISIPQQNHLSYWVDLLIQKLMNC